MAQNFNHYRTALYLSIVVALTNCLVCGLSVFLRPQNIRDVAGLCVLSLAIPAGLWLGSNFVRFAGAVFLVLWGGVLLWPWILSGAELRSGQLSLTLVFGFSAALSLVTATILLLHENSLLNLPRNRSKNRNTKGICGAVCWLR